MIVIKSGKRRALVTIRPQYQIPLFFRELMRSFTNCLWSKSCSYPLLTQFKKKPVHCYEKRWKHFIAVFRTFLSNFKDFFAYDIMSNMMHHEDLVYISAIRWLILKSLGLKISWYNFYLHVNFISTPFSLFFRHIMIFAKIFDPLKSKWSKTLGYR